ncbi:MAG: hypothetical protein ACOX3U_00650 [Christensenellales bacterium]|jgi:hypothetical protein
MIDPNMLMPLFQMMNKGSGGNASQFETILNALTQNKDGSGGQMNDMMKMLPMLMQLMNKQGNQPKAEEPEISEEKKDPFEPIRNIGNENINAMLYNLMNRN